MTKKLNKIQCTHCSSTPGVEPSKVTSIGSYKRSNNRVIVQRFLCHRCHRTFSNATQSCEYRQQKRQINQPLFELLASNVSMRRSAIVLNIDRKTVARRLVYFSKVAIIHHEEQMKNLPPVEEVHFDDMETFEHTKLKPISIPLAVAHPSRIIIGFDTAAMAAKGHLAATSRKKYGPRLDMRPAAWTHVLTAVGNVASPQVAITSDSHKRYPGFIRKLIPSAIHHRVKSRRACIAGQGELKVGGFDPIFSINHTAAMLRANICRLIRKTWCTTKRMDRLRCHIALFVLWHNETILAKQEKRKVSFPFANLQ